MSQHNKIANIYNPQNQNYEELLTSFVIRKKEFMKIKKELKVSNKASSIQHFLIEGQRGTGKTTLLLRLRYEIENDEELSHLIAVQFGEEQYGIYDLCRIWENAAEILEDIDGFENLSNDLDEVNEDKNYSTDCFGIVEKYLKKNNKRLVLLLDNFGDILDKLSEIEQKRLRDILHESKYIQLITTTSRSLEYTYKYDQPFFEFFKKIKLEGLDKEHTQILLEQLSTNMDNDIEDIIENQPNRIEIIRRLTGGIPRTIVLLFEIFLDESANVFEDLEAILDRVTPLYKHRMDDLPTQQQAIMDTIALNWDGITTREITDGLKKRGFNTKQVSSQLKVLERHDLIEARFIDKKNKVYLIKERFFNIWYLMRYGRKKNKQQVIWLIKFLEEWCSDDELVTRVKNHIKCAKEGNLHPKGGLYIAHALSSIIEDKKLQHELLDETKKALRKFDSNIDKKIYTSDIELFEKANTQYEKKEYQQSIMYLEKIQNKDNETYHNIGFIYDYYLKNYTLAIKYYKLAIDKNNIDSMNNLGVIYQEEIVNLDLAIKYYKMAIKNGQIDAMNNLAGLYHKEIKNDTLAIQHYEMAIEHNNIESMKNLALLYSSQEKYELSIKYYKMAIKHNDIEAMNNIGLLYIQFMDNVKLAVKYLKMASNKNHKDAMFNLAWLYYTENINKEDSLDLCINSQIYNDAQAYNFPYAIILLWNNKYKESIEKIKFLLNNPEALTKFSFAETLTNYFIFLLAKKQYHLAYNLFEEFKDLKNKLKPIYYALMKILKDKYPKEYLKMGSELEETVEEILIEVEEKREVYG